MASTQSDSRGASTPSGTQSAVASFASSDSSGLVIMIGTTESGLTQMLPPGPLTPSMAKTNTTEMTIASTHITINETQNATRHSVLPGPREGNPTLNITALRCEATMSSVLQVKPLIPSSRVALASKPLAQGGFGAVYRAVLSSGDGGPPQDVAVKIQRSGQVDLASLQEFANEARILSQLRHPNIVGWRGVSVSPAGVSVVIEFAAGGDLEGLLRDVSGLRDPYVKWPLRQRLQMLYQITDAVAYLHENNVVHCDIKPRNILLDSDRNALVADFGGSFVLGAGRVSRAHTKLYAAPEVMLGSYGTRDSDVYSLGCLIWEVLTHQSAHAADTRRANIYTLPNGHPMVRPWMLALVHRCMAGEASARWPAWRVRDVLVAMLDVLRSDHMDPIVGAMERCLAGQPLSLPKAATGDPPLLMSVVCLLLLLGRYSEAGEVLRAEHGALSETDAQSRLRHVALAVGAPRDIVELAPGTLTAEDELLALLRRAAGHYDVAEFTAALALRAPNLMIPRRMLCDVLGSADANSVIDVLQRWKVDDAPGPFGVTPLHVAACRCATAAVVCGNEDPIVTALVASGADVHAPNGDGERAVDVAIARNATVAANQLLTATHSGGPDTHPTSPSVPSMVQAVENCSPDVVRLLLSFGVPVDGAGADGLTPLFYACWKGSPAMTRLLVEAGANPRVVSKGWTPMHVAAGEGFVDVVEYLLGVDATLASVRTSEEWTPLHIAAQRGHTALVALLCERGAPVDAVNKNMATPLFIAAQNGYADVARTLLKHYANVEARRRDSSCPVLTAAIGGHAEVLRVLLDHGAAVDSTMDGISPLFLAAQNGHAEALEVLVERGADVHAVTPAGVTTLYIAAAMGHVKLVARLAQLHVNPAAATVDGRTAIQAAAEGGHDAVVALLRKMPGIGKPPIQVNRHGGDDVYHVSSPRQQMASPRFEMQTQMHQQPDPMPSSPMYAYASMRNSIDPPAMRRESRGSPMPESRAGPMPSRRK